MKNSPIGRNALENFSEPLKAHDLSDLHLIFEVASSYNTNVKYYFWSLFRN